MPNSTYQIILAVVLGLAWTWNWTAADSIEHSDCPAIDTAITRGTQFLIEHQSPDGAWRSGVYGVFKDGQSLTPQVLLSLQSLRPHGTNTEAAIWRGLTLLSCLIDAKGHVRQDLMFPAYNAAIASRLFPRHQSLWIDYLRARQLTENVGWAQSDLPFGGWGYSAAIPRKPAPTEIDPMAGSNLSATVAALEALREARAPRTDSTFIRALVFIERCQNFSSEADPQFDDGGFFFMPADAAWNKAGVAGNDRAGRVRFNSYGSATADGLRALLDVGLPENHPRVIAAREWLEKHFDPEANPGAFAPDREVLRNASYFYYCNSVARAFFRLHKATIPAHRAYLDWSAALAEALMHRQQPDGSWKNRFTDSKEDDPLVATPQALTTLTICRGVLDEKENNRRQLVR